MNTIEKLNLDALGFKGEHEIYRNLTIEKIIEHGLLNGETKMAMNNVKLL